MKIAKIIYILIIMSTFSCKKDIETLIKGNWYFIEIISDYSICYNEVFFGDSTLIYVLDCFNSWQNQNYIIRNDSLIRFDRFGKEELWRAAKIKFINKNQFQISNDDFNMNNVYHRIIGNHFTLDSIKNDDDYQKYDEAFIERKYIPIKKANIFYYNDHIYNDDDVYIIEEDIFTPNYEETTENTKI